MQIFIAMILTYTKTCSNIKIHKNVYMIVTYVLERSDEMKLNIRALKITLARRQMSVKELAERTGISYNTISSWLKTSSNRNPSLKMLGMISVALEVDVTELIED